MNKKHAAIIIGVILIAIGVVAVSSSHTEPSSPAGNPSISNGTKTPAASTGKHFEVNLSESVGIRAKP